MALTSLSVKPGPGGLSPTPGGGLWAGGHTTTTTAVTSNFCPGVILRSALENSLDKDSDSVETTSSESSARKNSRDPSSHRMIEKRRRDRMNNCLASLSKLIPQAYLNKSRGRVEKTEIIEMAIKYVKHVKAQQQATPRNFVNVAHAQSSDRIEKASADTKPVTASPPSTATSKPGGVENQERYRQGFYDCIAETMRFLAGLDSPVHGGALSGTSDLSSRLMSHLEGYCAQKCQGPRTPESTSVIQKTSPVPASCGVTEDEPLNMSLKPNHHMGNAMANLQDSTPNSNSTSNSNGSSHFYNSVSGFHPQNPGGVGIGGHPTQGGAEHNQNHHLHHQLSPPGAHLGGGEKSAGSSSCGSSTHYPSSPGSFQSVGSGHSATPPRSVTPPYGGQNGLGVTGLDHPQSHHNALLPRVPVFALHASGQFYFADSVSGNALNIDINALASATSICGQEELRSDCHLVSIPVKFNMESFMVAQNHKINTTSNSCMNNLSTLSSDQQSRGGHHPGIGGGPNPPGGGPHHGVVSPPRDWTSALAHFDPRQRIAAHFGTAPDSSTNGMDHP